MANGTNSKKNLILFVAMFLNVIFTLAIAILIGRSDKIMNLNNISLLTIYTVVECLAIMYVKTKYNSNWYVYQTIFVGSGLIVGYMVHIS